MALAHVWRHRHHPRAALRAQRVTRRNLTYLNLHALTDLHDRVQEVEDAGIPGVIIEAGVALGGSAVMLAAAKRKTRPLRLYDVFGMIPPPSDHDGEDVHARYGAIARGESEGLGGDVYYGYRSDLKGQVVDVLTSFGYPPRHHSIKFVEGLYEDTLYPDQPIALAHVDADWYESVRICLERIWPAVVEGGAMILDDYDQWSGCRKAVDEWIVGRTDVAMQRRARVHLQKLGAS